MMNISFVRGLMEGVVSERQRHAKVAGSRADATSWRSSSWSYLWPEHVSSLLRRSDPQPSPTAGSRFCVGDPRTHPCQLYSKRGEREANFKFKRLSKFDWLFFFRIFTVSPTSFCYFISSDSSRVYWIAVLTCELLDAY